MLVSLGGHQHGDRKVTETSVIEICHSNENSQLRISDTPKSTLPPVQEPLSQQKPKRQLINWPA